MNKPKIKTIGELKSSDYTYKSLNQEITDNLRHNLSEGINVFSDLIGYEETVIPSVERAFLSNHSINLLGLRGQAKTKLARTCVNLLDEWIPIIKGSETNDDPRKPIFKSSIEKIKSNGDKTEIDWLHRDERFYEKLATPDVTVSDLIGDIDPIKATNLKLSYSNEEVIHFGLIPRAHRCIFVLNELPDLQPRIQVSLFSILEEKEIQIRGFKVRLPLDIQFIFTSNPEDYTNRGTIVTPLKDRVGSQILTHYPESIEVAKKITLQESKINSVLGSRIHIPEVARDIIEQISFEARESDLVDRKSGVSARMSITSLQNLVSSAERRMIINNEEKTSIRMSDFSSVISSINGKVELVYEGEEEGAEQVSYNLISSAVKSIFNKYFPKIEKLTKPDEITPYDSILKWFSSKQLVINDNLKNKDYEDLINQVKDAKKLIEEFIPKLNKDDELFFIEFILWGLESYNKLSILRTNNGIEYKDPFNNFINKI